jgi:hypothetical protein
MTWCATAPQAMMRGPQRPLFVFRRPVVQRWQQKNAMPVPQVTALRFRTCHSPSVERVRWSHSVHKENAMSDNNNERRELTAAELDLVAGAAPIYMHYVDGFMAPRNAVSDSFLEVTMADVLISS